MSLRSRVFFAVLVMCAFAVPAKGGIISVASRTDLAGNDDIDWSQYGPSGTTVISHVSDGFPTSSSFPSFVTAHGTVGVTGSAVALVPSTYSPDLVVNSLDGLPSIQMASNGLTTNSSSVHFGLYVDLTFDQPIFGLGADIASFSSPTHSGLGLSLSAFDVNGHGLGEVQNNDAFGFNGFVGLKTTNSTPDIKSVRIETAATWDGQTTYTTYLKINQVDLLTSAGPSTAVPEPSSLTLLGLGAIGFLGFIRRCRVSAA